jgi:hypothetical protein
VVNGNPIADLLGLGLLVLGLGYWLLWRFGALGGAW